MTDLTEYSLKPADLPRQKPTAFNIQPTRAEMSEIAEELGIPGLSKLRFVGKVIPLDGGDWHLTGDLGASVRQECIVSLAPVTTRIDEQVERFYRAEFIWSDQDESEMPEDDSEEPLGKEINPALVMVEALSLSLPLYPRADGVEHGETVVTEPGAEPLTDEAAKPFAGLAALRDKLSSE